MFEPVLLKNISFYFDDRSLFEDFSTIIYPGSRIAIIGRNGSGKSCLLKILKRELFCESGKVEFPKDLSVGYIEQTVGDFETLSGGQRFNKRLSEVLAKDPDLLLLDEPTNHLDESNRKSLMRMLNNYHGTVIVVSHDKELLRNCIDILWNIEDQKISEFAGYYDDFIREKKKKKEELQKELSLLNNDKKQMHSNLMKEQKRAKASHAKGKKSIDQNKWPTIVSHAKARRAQETSGKKKKQIDNKKQDLLDQISDLGLPETISPTFSLDSQVTSSGTLLTIHDGELGYTKDKVILSKVSLTLMPKERIAICGDNGSGKSALLKAILEVDGMHKKGSWHGPKKENIGYLDQHYSLLQDDQTVLDHLKAAVPEWEERVIRRHLSDFLFRKNDEVHKKAEKLSGGERARLTLCLIAAKPKQLLILDEVTNNLDLETKEHVTEVLQNYPGAIIAVSHEKDFLKEIGIEGYYKIANGEMVMTT